MLIIKEILRNNVITAIIIIGTIPKVLVDIISFHTDLADHTYVLMYKLLIPFRIIVAPAHAYRNEFCMIWVFWHLSDGFSRELLSLSRPSDQDLS